MISEVALGCTNLIVESKVEIVEFRTLDLPVVLPTIAKNVFLE